MNRIVIGSVVCLLFVEVGCCKQKVVAFIMQGEQDTRRCLETAGGIDAGAPPLAITCPGEKVTVCYGANEVKKVKITVTPDPDGKSGTYDQPGALVLNPKASTTVKVESDCNSVTRSVTVVNGDTPATFDAKWDTKCQGVTYLVDPLFVSAAIQAKDVSANWTIDCPTPKFLNGTHSLFSFTIDLPNTVTPFLAPQPAIGQWGYSILAKCDPPFKCDPKKPYPFVMTFFCPAGIP